MELENLAKSMARRNTLRWILQQWNGAIQTIRRERMEEQNIADEWKLVDEWLKEQTLVLRNVDNVLIGST